MCKYCDEIVAAEIREKAMASGADDDFNGDPGSLDVVTSVERERIQKERCEHGVSLWQWCEDCKDLRSWWLSVNKCSAEVLMGVGDIFDCSEMD